MREKQGEQVQEKKIEANAPFEECLRWETEIQRYKSNKKREMMVLVGQFRNECVSLHFMEWVQS